MIGILTSEFLGKIQTVYFHGSCPDGISARELLKQLFEDRVTYIPYYFQELPEIPEFALFIDCSPKPHQLKGVLEKGGVIVEHHETRLEELQELLKTFPQQILYGEGLESGTWLAMEILKQQKIDIKPGTETIAELIAIGDTWKKEDPRFEYARMVSGYIAFFGNAFDYPIYKLPEIEKTIRDFGAAQARSQKTLAKQAIKFHGGHIAFINSLLISDSAEILRSTGTVIIVGWVVKKAEESDRTIVTYSLRSDETFDVGAFCKSMGGGGHKSAAGFETTYIRGIDPVDYCLHLLEAARHISMYGEW